jgi:hypothetical protein
MHAERREPVARISEGTAVRVAYDHVNKEFGRQGKTGVVERTRTHAGDTTDFDLITVEDKQYVVTPDAISTINGQTIGTNIKVFDKNPDPPFEVPDDADEGDEIEVEYHPLGEDDTRQLFTTYLGSNHDTLLFQHKTGEARVLQSGGVYDGRDMKIGERGRVTFDP